jgi:hypothetical protein
MRRRDRWCRDANDIVIDIWRYARRLGRTTAERIAVFEVEMERLERRGADATRSHAKRRGTFIKTAIADMPPPDSRGRLS